MAAEPLESDPLRDLVGQASLVVHSTDLFGDKRLVLIRHNGDWYRLVVTKQNKLILMK